MKKMSLVMTLALGLFGAAQFAQACSINAGGRCAGSACPTGETCTKASDGLSCSCVKDEQEKKDTKDQLKEAAGGMLDKATQ